MAYGHDNIEEAKADRLSNLPDDLIHKIFSFISFEDTVKTMVLSSRYRFIWTTMPYINISTWSFPGSKNFVDDFLNRRNNQIDMSSLKHLRIEIPAYSSLRIKATSILELPALTTLYLGGVTFDRDDHDNCFVVGLFSKCTNLKNLTLERCEIDGSSSICHPGLSNLTLDDFGRGVLVNVVAPQLENLTIYNMMEHVISAPNLVSLAYRGDYPLTLSTDGFYSLKKADIRVVDHRLDVGAAHRMVCLLQQLHNVKFLTLNLEIIELFSKSVELISHQPSPFVNLKSLTIYPEVLYDPWEGPSLPKGKVHLSSEVKRYLLDSSPGASVTMFSREETIAARDFASAQESMAELRELLEQFQEKTDTKTNSANTNRGKAPIEGDNAKMQVDHIGQNSALIWSCWEDMSKQLKQRKATVRHIIDTLERIERLLIELPATKRAKIQARFSSLCVEADTVMRKIMKMQCDEQQSRISVCLHELATSTTMEPFS